MNEIQVLLSSKKTVEVKKAAKFLQKNLIPELEDSVLAALQREMLRNIKSWETKSELIKCIGLNKYKKALPIIEDIAEKNEEHDMITISAGATLVRLKKKNNSDVSEIIYRLQTMKFSLGYGMFEALGQDKMIPSKEDIKKIIDSAWDFGKNSEKQYGDPRYGLVIACAGWDKELVTDFLKHCIETGDESIKNAAEYSLKGIYLN